MRNPGRSCIVKGFAILCFLAVACTFQFSLTSSRYLYDGLADLVSDPAAVYRSISMMDGEGDDVDDKKMERSETETHFCASWEVNTDDWWTHHPDWDVTYENDTTFCFSRIDNPRSEFLRQIHASQFNNNCSKVHVRNMVSSGWGADMSHLSDGLLEAYQNGRPFQIGKRYNTSAWHYTHFGDKAACPKKDVSCYFLPHSDCQPRKDIEPLKTRTRRRDWIKKLWVIWYATRPQQWLRRRIYDYLHSSGPHIETPCTAIHVRRADVVLHSKQSRRYFAIKEYLDAIPNLEAGSNLLLFTDDANAIDEAHEFHPQYNWMYVNRTRFRGAEGGFESQIPSKDPVAEVVSLLAEFKLAKNCDALVHTKSGFATLLHGEMVSTGRDINRIQIDDGKMVHSKENKLSAQRLAEQLEEERRRKQQLSCAPNKGLVILNLLGRLGNNLYEVGFANLIATELCWDVVYRRAWQSQFLEEPAQKCFPNSLLTARHNYSIFDDEQLLQQLSITPSLPIWKEDRKSFLQWVDDRGAEGLLSSCNNRRCDFREDGLNKLLSSLRNTTSTVRVLNLSAFFVHYDWIHRLGTDKLKKWLTPHASCCQHIPPENAVVIHIRDFGQEKSAREKELQLTVSAYMDILKHYNLVGRPVWIVCQPSSVNLTIINDLVNETSALVHTGDDQFDAFCILQRARTLILSFGSTFSHMGALLSEADEIHYPLHKLKNPEVTISVPSWKYHLVNETRNGIREFDVSHERLIAKMD